MPVLWLAELLAVPKIRRIDFSPDEWLAGTASLDNDERGLYITACALIYSHGGPVPVEELRARQRDHGNAFNRQLKRLVTLGKLVRNGREITNKRCENELQNARKRSETGRENVSKRWSNNTLDQETVDTNGNANHQPSTINHQPDTPKPPPSGGFDGSRSGEGSRANGSSPRAKGSNPRATVPEHIPEPPWRQRCASFAKSGFWNDFWGPKPSEPGCHAPAAIIAELHNQEHP